LRCRGNGGDEQQNKSGKRAAVGVYPYDKKQRQSERPAPLSAMNRGKNPQLGGERERREDLRTRGEAVGNFHDRQRAESPRDEACAGTHLLASN